jgi:hypothetical protein
MKSHLFKLEGHEVVPVNNVYDWCDWMDAGNLTVDWTTVDGFGVSTCFLGLAPPESRDGPPLLFETVLMRGQRLVRLLERYTTWDDAEKGHKKWTQAVRDKRVSLMSTQSVN